LQNLPTRDGKRFGVHVIRSRGACPPTNPDPWSRLIGGADITLKLVKLHQIYGIHMPDSPEFLGGSIDTYIVITELLEYRCLKYRCVCLLAEL